MTPPAERLDGPSRSQAQRVLSAVYLLSCCKSALGQIQDSSRSCRISGIIGPPGMKTPRALIADQQATARLGVRIALESAGFEVCAEAAHAAGAVESAIREEPDVCLLAIGMPGNGIAAAREIAREVPSTQIVMLATSTEGEDLFDSVRAGAVGYLMKSTDPARLPLALRGVISGEAAFPRPLLRQLIDRLRELERVEGDLEGCKLTEREREVLELLSAGVPDSAIALRLSISAVTVRRHISHIVRKLGVVDRGAAVAALEARTAPDDMSGRRPA